MKLAEKFEQLKKEGKKAFNVYFPFGFPQISFTPDIFFALEDAGVDIIELGFPFSDPLADGPIIQNANSLALKQKISMDVFFKVIAKMKNKVKIPIVVMSYYNPVFRYGVDKFFYKLAENKIAGTILVDLPLEESKQYLACTKKFNIDPIFFITPATSIKRAKNIIRAARGFIYYVSVTGITGPRALKFTNIAAHVKEVKKITDIPVCVGFGIHNKAQVKKINSFADGVIVGSKIVNFIGENYKKKNFLKSLKKEVKNLHA